MATRVINSTVLYGEEVSLTVLLSYRYNLRYVNTLAIIMYCHTHTTCMHAGKHHSWQYPACMLATIENLVFTVLPADIMNTTKIHIRRYSSW